MSQGTTLLIGILGTLAVGAVTALLTTWLNLKRFYSEKWWTLKAEAYSKIIEALHHAGKCYSEWSDEDLQHQDLSEEKTKQLSADFDNAHREIVKATGIGAYIISEEAAKVLADLAGRPRSFDTERFARFELYDEEAKAHSAALAKIRALAKKDLQIK